MPRFAGFWCGVGVGGHAGSSDGRLRRICATRLRQTLEAHVCGGGGGVAAVEGTDDGGVWVGDDKGGIQVAAHAAVYRWRFTPPSTRRFTPPSTRRFTPPSTRRFTPPSTRRFTPPAR